MAKIHNGTKLAYPKYGFLTKRKPLCGNRPRLLCLSDEFDDPKIVNCKTCIRLQS